MKKPFITYLGILFLLILLSCEGLKHNAELNREPIVKLTEFKNGRWLSTTDTLSGIEIKNGKWIMFYKGIESDSSEIYTIEIRRKYMEALGTEHSLLNFCV